MADSKSKGRSSVAVPMDQWDWGHMTDLQKVILCHPDFPPDLGAISAEVRLDPSLARFAWDNGRTLLHEAASARHEGLVRLLIESGADVNAVAPDGTPLYEAGGDMHTLLLLLAAGADPNIPDCRGCTPLYGALLNHDIEVAKFLMAHGAVPMDEYSRNSVRELREAGLV